LKNTVFQPIHIASAVLDGKICATAHAKAQEDRRQKGHQRIGSADCRQRVLTDESANHKGIRQIIKLLEQIAENQRERKPDQPGGNVSCSEVLFHICIRPVSYI
jgi:hypothetical protein